MTPSLGRWAQAFHSEHRTSISATLYYEPLGLLLHQHPVEEESELLTSVVQPLAYEAKRVKPLSRGSAKTIVWNEFSPGRPIYNHTARLMSHLFLQNAHENQRRSKTNLAMAPL